MHKPIGPLSQIAYVVADLDQAILHWTQTLRIGPFIRIPHIEFSRFEFAGRLRNPDVSIALAYSGAMQIELVQQHNDEPSVFLQSENGRPNGMHHTGVFTEDLDGDLEFLIAAGMRKLQHNIALSGAETVFLDGRDIFPGTFELIR